MKKELFMVIALLTSGNAFAGVDHYILRDNHHVHHLKINTVGDNIIVTTDVDFEPNSDETGGHACSATISGDAKRMADNELLLKKHIEGEVRTCTIQIHLIPNGASLEQSPECSYYAAGICHFSSDGKELQKIK